MLINVRKVAVNIAVISFFSLSIITSLSGLSPFICCKRAVIGAALTYIATNLVLRIINMILIDAMITNQMDQPVKSERTQKKDKAGR
jgi:hypothetical protein